MVCAMDINNLEQILTLLKKNDVSEFELNQEGVQLRLVRGAAQVQTVAVPNIARVGEISPAISASGSSSSGEPVSSESAIPESWVRVESPIVGTFYRKPSPDAELFCKEGDSVKKGDTLCIVEAMKLMNEIDAKISGRIEKVLPADGQVVEYGEVLFFINPHA